MSGVVSITRFALRPSGDSTAHEKEADGEVVVAYDQAGMSAVHGTTVRAKPWHGLSGLLVAIVVLALAGPALAAGVWSAPDPVDPAIIAESVSCSSASFCMAVGFTGSASGSAAIYKDGTWSEASLIDPGSQLFSVSCTSSSFCMVLSGSSEAFIYNGSTWSAPIALGTDLTSVSCTSASFCAAVGGGNEAAIYDGHTWSTPIKVGLAGVRSVSCVSESFCVAVGSTNGEGGYAITYKGSSWSAPTEIDTKFDDGLSSVSCVSESFCVTFGNGDELTYNGSTWSTPTPIGGGGPNAVSCHSESFCVEVSAGGETLTYNGSTWKAGQVSERAARVVSCPTESFCVAVGGYASSYNGSSWTAAVPVGGGGLSSVSCSSSSFCTAVDWHGRVLTDNDGTWSAPSEIDAEGGLSSVSCPTESFCMAVADDSVGASLHGYALTYKGGSWSAPAQIDSAGGLHSVSCPSSSFCAAVDGAGHALTYSSGTWSAPSEIEAEDNLESVSCASESFCMAVGGHDAVIYTHGAWSTPSPVDTEDRLKSVSCSSASFCVAVAEHNGPAWADAYALTYNTGVWSAPSEIPRAPDRGGFSVGSVSCVSSYFCMAGAEFEGAAAISENGVWSVWDPLEVNGQFSSVSCPAASFCVVVNNGGQAFTYSNPAAGAPPSEVVTEPAEAGGNGFRLNGKLNPGNSPTTYYFEYLGDNEVECLEGENCWHETAYTGPVTGGSQQGVASIEVTGLRLGETYRYRLVAENAKGTERGKVLTFTVMHTFPPSVGSESVSKITEHGATLEAQVNPHGEESYRTTWVFEYGTSTAYGESTPTPAGLFNSEECRYIEIIPCGINTPQTVSESLTGLEPGTTYHYRIAATNSWGTSYGEDATFTTQGSRAQPLGGEETPPGTGGDGQSGTLGTGTGSGGSSSPGITPLGSRLGKSKSKSLTLTEKLGKALKQCKKDKSRSKREACEKQARKRYASAAKKKGKKSKFLDGWAPPPQSKKGISILLDAR